MFIAQFIIFVLLSEIYIMLRMVPNFTMNYGSSLSFGFCFAILKELLHKNTKKIVDAKLEEVIIAEKRGGLGVFQLGAF